MEPKDAKLIAPEPLEVGDQGLVDDDLGVCPIAVEVHHEAPLLDAGHLAHEAPEALELHLTTAQTIEFTLFKKCREISATHLDALADARARRADLQGL